MIEIPGFRYDVSIKNYVPILLDTPENRALNLNTAAKILKYESLNNIKHQIASSKESVVSYRKLVYPFFNKSAINIYNINKYQQTSLHNVTTNQILRNKSLLLSKTMNIEIDEDDELNSYHSIYKSFNPDYNSQLVMSSYSSSPYSVHYSLFNLDFYNDEKRTLKFRSQLIKRFDYLKGLKMSLNQNKIALMSKKECCIINKDDYKETKIKFHRELPDGLHHSFDLSDKLIIGVNSKKGTTHLAQYDFSSNEFGYETRKCDWDRKYVFRDLVFDINGINSFFLLRGRMNDSNECILHYDSRCAIPSAKNIRRLALNFHQNSTVQMKRVPNSADFLITHCYDGRCALWDMRWKSRPAVTYQNISPGNPNLPIDIDSTGQFVTMTDSDNVVRVFNLRTGLVLFSEQQTPPSDNAGQIFSFYSHSGFRCRPCLVSNFSPSSIELRELQF